MAAIGEVDELELTLLVQSLAVDVVMWDAAVPRRQWEILSAEGDHRSRRKCYTYDANESVAAALLPVARTTALIRSSLSPNGSVLTAYARAETLILVRPERMSMLVGSGSTTYKHRDDLGKDMRKSVLVLLCPSIALAVTTAVQVHTPKALTSMSGVVSCWAGRAAVARNQHPRVLDHNF
jgi:hypothetical protein